MGKRIPFVDGQENQESTRTGRGLGQRCLNFIEVLVLLAVASQIVGCFARFHFVADLTTHFRVQSALSLLLGGITLLVCRRSRLGLIGLSVGIILALSLLPFFLPGATFPASQPYRLLVMNVLTRNANKLGVVEYIRQQDPDFFVLLEVDHRWVGEIKTHLQDHWPFQIADPHGNNFGVLLCSKRVWAEASVVYFGDKRLPSIDATFDNVGDRFRIVGTHPLPPMSARNWTSRNTQLSRVSESIRDSDLRDSTLLAGDLNCSPWSPFFASTLRTSGLSDSARGRGLHPTWFALPTYLAGLPIDHVCTGANIKVLQRQVGPDLGSDHRAVVVDFVVTD